MKKYRSYHTMLKRLAQRNTLPQSYSSNIDRSTLWRWRREPENKYTGSELVDIEVLEEFILRKEAQTIMRNYMRLVISIASFLSVSNEFGRMLQSNKESFVRVFSQYQKVTDIKMILRLLKLPVSVFYYWKNQFLYQCVISPFGLCKRIYPHQLTVKEANVIKEPVSSDKFQYWPICSLAWYASRKNLLHVSLSTWYKYVRKLGLSKLRIKKKKSYTKGISAVFPNQVWHADITVVKSLDGMKNYVYLLMDNYSKYIINWRLESVVSGEIRTYTIKEGYQEHIKGLKNLQLIMDGGPENNNHNMDNYIGSEGINISKLVAQKDIPYSNSQIEVQNMLIKYRYLFKCQFQDIYALHKPGLQPSKATQLFKWVNTP